MYLLCYGKSESAFETGKRLMDNMPGRWITGADFVSGRPPVPEGAGEPVVVMIVPLEICVRIISASVSDEMRNLPVICVSPEGLYAAAIRSGALEGGTLCEDAISKISQIIGSKCFTKFGDKADIAGDIKALSEEYHMTSDCDELMDKVAECVRRGNPVRIYTDLKTEFKDPVTGPMNYELYRYPSDMRDEFIRQYRNVSAKSEDDGIYDIFITCSYLGSEGHGKVLTLTPRSIHIGIEQDSKTDPEYAAEGVIKSLINHKINPDAVRTVSVSYSARESGSVINIADKLGAKIIPYDNNELLSTRLPLNMTFSPSKINDIATSAAYLSSGGGDIIIRRSKGVRGLVFSAVTTSGTILLS